VRFPKVIRHRRAVAKIYGKSKTRSRRLAPLCGALEKWLAPYRNCSGPLWDKLVVTFHDKFLELRQSLGVPIRRNGLRHRFCSFHFALHANENLTAALAGNSPAMIHAHYKGLATKTEAEKWFAVKPAKVAQNVIPLSTAAGKPE
jgi:hypothetical protein